MGVDGEGQSSSAREEAWLVSGSENGKAVIWDVASRNVVGILEGHERPIVALAVRPDGKRIATGSLEPEKTIQIWNYDSSLER
jgi:COMPASS component SWD3